jgi:hypothetical protein
MAVYIYTFRAHGVPSSYYSMDESEINWRCPPWAEHAYDKKVKYEHDHVFHALMFASTSEEAQQEFQVLVDAWEELLQPRRRANKRAGEQF